jgi:hypothetical protein
MICYFVGILTETNQFVQFSSPEITVNDNEITYNEKNTSPFSYYILKSYLMNNIDNFILWSDTNNFDVFSGKSSP